MNKILLTLFFTLILIGCKDKQTTQEMKPEIIKDVKAQELKMQTIKNTKIYNGDINPLKEIAIITPTGGYAKNIKYKNGDIIDSETTILTLTDAATEASYFEAEGNLIKSRSNYSTSKISFEKYKNLFEKKLISEELYLQSKNNMNQSLGELKIAEANFIRANDNYKRLFVKSEIPGIITDLEAKNNEKIPSNSKLLTVVENNIMEIKIAINGEDIKNITHDKEAKIYISDLNKTVIGKVSEINLAADTDTKKYNIKIQIPNDDKSILKGMYGKVEMEQMEVNGLFVPQEAIMIKDLYSYVAIIRENQAIIYKVNRGVSQGNLQEIYFDNFKEGDKIVIQGQYLLNNNDKVREI